MRGSPPPAPIPGYTVPAYASPWGFFDPTSSWGMRPPPAYGPPTPPGYGTPTPRQGVMTKARAPVTARPYVQLEPPAEEGAYTPTEQAFAPYLPEMPYGGGDTGYPPYGDGGGGGGGGGYPPSAPREVPPWYYGLISWRF